ncbi:MAG: hypothetical protein D6772_11220, partial [Bacteroidetes bacterium]
MQIVEITQGGVIDPEDILWLGGSYSWLKRIRRGGIGSPKVIYVSGIPSFDQLSHGVAGQTTFANFELLTEGLLLRANCTQRLAAVATRYEALKAIRLTGYPVKVRGPRRWRSKTANYDVVYKGALTVVDQEDQAYYFATRVSEFEAVKAFFSKAPEFAAIFSTGLSPIPLQEDSALARQLDL